MLLLLARRRRLHWLGLWACAAIFVGCAKDIATLQAWKPAPTTLPGIRRVAVLPLAGPESPAILARQTMEEEMAKSQLYEVIDPAAVVQLAPKGVHLSDGTLNQNAAVMIGRQLGADAVLAGRIAFDDANGKPTGDKLIQFRGPTAAVTVYYQILDARTGIVQVSEKATDEFRGEISDREGDANGKVKVFTRLVTRSAELATAKIAPHREEVQVELAKDWVGRGADKVRQGNGLARDGKWNEALAIWQVALAEDAENHAAQYNVGLAHEALGDFRAAQEHFERATRISDQKLYRTAATRNNSALADMGQVVLQRQQQMASIAPVVMPVVAVTPTLPYGNLATFAPVVAPPADVTRTARPAPIGPAPNDPAPTSMPPIGDVHPRAGTMWR